MSNKRPGETPSERRVAHPMPGLSAYLGALTERSGQYCSYVDDAKKLVESVTPLQVGIDDVSHAKAHAAADDLPLRAFKTSDTREHNSHPAGERQNPYMSGHVRPRTVRHPLLSKEIPSFAVYLQKLSEESAPSRTTIPDPVIERPVEGGHTRLAQIAAGETVADSRVHDSHPIGDRRSKPAPTRFRLLGRMGTIWRSLIGRVLYTDDAKFIGNGYYPELSLGRWGYFLAAKIGMYWHGLIDFHPLENLGFAVFILLPVRSRILRVAKTLIAIVLAVSLLYYDSWLPPVSRLLSGMSSLSDFGMDYLFELMGRFINGYVVGSLILASAAYWMVWRKYRVGVFVALGILLLFVVQGPLWRNVLHDDAGNGLAGVAQKVRPDLDQVLQSFFDREAQRAVLFTPPPADAHPFDVIFIHVCSLSWDDVQAVGLADHPLWKRFDMLFSQFNSATSYSGSAAIHLLRAPCGQQKHGKMYGATADHCYLMGALEKAGFAPDLVLNHDGKFDNFLGQVTQYGRVTVPPMSLGDVHIAQYAFDKSPVYDDFSVLNRWLAIRQASGKERVALYYNTISLHDGNHPPGAVSRPNTLDTYRDRLAQFLDDTASFMDKLESSGRRAVVVMVPEHGAALRGDKRQIAGLRDIPTPAITIVPVGIRVIGVPRTGDTVLVSQTSSFLAISTIIERMLKKSPYDEGIYKPAEYARDLPVTPFVAQSERTTVLEYNHLYHLNRGGDSWEDYTEFNQPVDPL